MEPNSDKLIFSILFADDGSEHARAAISLLIDLNLPKPCHVHLLRVITPLQASEHDVYEASVQKTRKLISDHGMDASAELLLGYPAEKIVEYSDVLKPDLIVMGAKGLRSTLGILLGGVAQQVVEYASCPVLIVRAPYNGLSRILVASDGSGSSMEALKYLIKNISIPDTRVDVIHVLPPYPIPMAVVEPMFMDIPAAESWEVSEEELTRRRKEENDGEVLLNTCTDQLKRTGFEAQGILRRGDAATRMIEYARDEKIDLIISGSRGLSQIKSWLMGSVSRKLVHYSNCSILVVRNCK